MARRKAPPSPALDLADFPHSLRRDVVVVEDFVPSWEQPPSWLAGEPEGDEWWRRIRALRRWQDAVAGWAAERGLSRHQAQRLGWYWPSHPPPFACERGGQYVGQAIGSP